MKISLETMSSSYWLPSQSTVMSIDLMNISHESQEISNLSIGSYETVFVITVCKLTQLVICCHICKNQRPHGINQMYNWEFEKSGVLYLFFFFYSVQAKALMDLTCKNVCSIFFAPSFFFRSVKSLGVSLASWSCSDQEFLTLLLHTHFSLWKEGSVRVVIALKL